MKTFTYRFYNHSHPYVRMLIDRLNKGSMNELQDTDTDIVLHEEIFSDVHYTPTDMVEEPYPVKKLDFSPSGAYSVYNWELFYHIPLTVAIHLSKNQRFEEAQRWLHYIFDPTDDSDGDTPERFWKVRPLQNTDVKLVEDLLINLATDADPDLREQTINSIEAWEDNPFRPHLIARYRPSTYMFKAVMAYLDNLIAWGDSLFRQDTRESLNEATQLYVLAMNILGPRPQPVPKRRSVRSQTYANLKDDLKTIGNALSELEDHIMFSTAPHPAPVSDNDKFVNLRNIGNSLYFCVPRNDKLLGYWDTVADRLFKIRNSLNIQGIFRQLPLFEPPIDPALLARSTAAGLDVSAIVAGLSQPLPLVRFQFLIQKATEICQEIKSLGANLLSTMEKGDNEALAILRAKHEGVVLELAEVVKYGQWQETIKAREGVEISLANAVHRYMHYEQLLGREKREIETPQLEGVDTGGLEKLNYTSGEPVVSPRAFQDLIAKHIEGESGGKQLSMEEVLDLRLLKAARSNLNTAADWEKFGSAVGVFFPAVSMSVNIPFVGSVSSSVPPIWHELIRFIANCSRTNAEKQTYEAGKLSKMGSYGRREQDWALQSNLAAGELTHIYKQLRAAQIREAVAEREWNNHKQQIKHAEEIEQFLTDEKIGKATNQAFYAWMKREVKGLYGQCYEFAYEIAKKAERGLQHELANPELSYLQPTYLAGREGLLAGEKLFLDLKRMEMAYHDLNQREYELTINVSLLQVDPLALVQLRATGRCNATLPEEYFDFGCPSHYFRRIKSVAVSLPGVTGPNVGINCTLTLLKSSIRKTPRLDDGEYKRSGLEDSRFDNYFGSQQSIVTSAGQNDPGMFETNLRDERYLPFEGSGVISEWQLQLPVDPSKKEPQQFDYDTISDVILHIRYTAREGGEQMRKGALTHLAKQIEAANTVGSVRLFSIRHEFPGEWAKFKAAKAENGWFKLSLPLREEHYPFWSRGRLEEIKRVDLLAKTDESINAITVADRADEHLPQGEERKEDSMAKDDSLGGLCVGPLVNIPRPETISADERPFTLYFDNNAMEELWVAVAWGCLDKA